MHAPLLIRPDDGAEITEKSWLNQKVVDEIVTKVNELSHRTP